MFFGAFTLVNVVFRGRGILNSSLLLAPGILEEFMD
jgi:hypothetical protein